MSKGQYEREMESHRRSQHRHQQQQESFSRRLKMQRVKDQLDKTRRAVAQAKAAQAGHHGAPPYGHAGLDPDGRKGPGKKGKRKSKKLDALHHPSAIILPEFDAEGNLITPLQVSNPGPKGHRRDETTPLRRLT